MYLYYATLVVIADNRLATIPNFIRRDAWRQISDRLGQKLRFYMIQDGTGRLPTADELPVFNQRLVRTIILDLNHLRFLGGLAADGQNAGNEHQRRFQQALNTFTAIKGLLDVINLKYRRLHKLALVRVLNGDPTLSTAQWYFLSKKFLAK